MTELSNNWVTMNPASGASGTALVTVSVPQYTGRTTRTKVITGTSGEHTAECTVTQQGIDQINVVTSEGSLDRVSQVRIPSKVQDSVIYIETNLLNLGFVQPEGILLPDGNSSTVKKYGNVLERNVPFGTDFDGDPGAEEAVVCCVTIRPATQNTGRNPRNFISGVSGENDDEAELEIPLTIVQEGLPEFVSLNQQSSPAAYDAGTIVVTGVSNSPNISFKLQFDRGVKTWCAIDNEQYSIDNGGTSLVVPNGGYISPDLGATNMFEFTLTLDVVSPNTTGAPRSVEIYAEGTSAEASSSIVVRQNSSTIESENS